MIYGCLPAKKDLRDYKIVSSRVDTKFPASYELSGLPKVKNQGKIGSCCAHATAEILEFHNRNKSILSTNFIYGIQYKICGYAGKGMYLADACKIVTTYGDPIISDCKGNTEIPTCRTTAEVAFNNANIMKKAANYKTSSYYLCQTDNDIKYALMNFGPVLGAINWKDDYQLDNDFVIHFNGTKGGGHAVLIYGWNEKGWLIQNSWGDNWGNKGRFILPFDYGFYEARAIIDYVPKGEKAVVKPVNNKVLNIFYKLANTIISKFCKADYINKK